MQAPFNQFAHDFLVLEGYVYTHHEEEYFENGNPESGPRLSGHPAYDEYESEVDRVFIAETSTGYEIRDLEMELWCDEQITRCTLPN